MAGLQASAGTRPFSVGVPHSHDSAVAVARHIAEKARLRAAETDSNRHVPMETIAELASARLFDVVTPRIEGGLDLGIRTLLDVTIELASACGSTGWVYGVLAGHSWLINLFPIETQRVVRANPEALSATVFRLSGDTTRVPGGFLLKNGQGRFCSGIDHASWVVIGNTVQGSGDQSDFMFFVVPRSEFEIIDDWHTVGMRGTGSKTIKVSETFIPEARAIRLADMVRGMAPGAQHQTGTVFRLSFADITPFSILGAPLGCAKGAVQLFRDELTKRQSGQGGPIAADANTLLARLASADAEVTAAIELVRSDASFIDSAESISDIGDERRASLPRNWAFAVQTARRAVNKLFEAAGGSATYQDAAILRIWRDVNAGAQHVAFGWDRAMTNYGRFLIGISPEEIRFGKS